MSNAGELYDPEEGGSLFPHSTSKRITEIIFSKEWGGSEVGVCRRLREHSDQATNNLTNTMAIKLVANYSKRLGLPGYSSHQFSVSLETELVSTDGVPAEAGRLYDLLQRNVDEQIQATGFVPPTGYGLGEGPHPSISRSKPGGAAASPGMGVHPTGPQDATRWSCTPRQRELILNLMAEQGIDQEAADLLAVERGGKALARLDKIEASVFITGWIQSPPAKREPMKEDIPPEDAPVTLPRVRRSRRKQAS